MRLSRRRPSDSALSSGAEVLPPMLIRPERATDIAAIRALTDAAFADVPQSRQTESAIIDGLRDSGALTVSLVAVEDGVIVGHVALSPVTVNGVADTGWYGGGPLSVLPERQREGIGTALVAAAREQLTTLGAAGVVLVGDPHYYVRFGFADTPSLVVAGVPAENVLALSMSGPIPRATVAFHPAFEAERTEPPALRN